MELNNGIQKDWIRSDGFSQATLRLKPGLGGTQVSRKKRAIKKNKLIDIGLRVAFGWILETLYGR